MATYRDDRRGWRLLWLGSIQAFADSYTQQTRWPATVEARHHTSFSGCMSGYFDHANLRERNAYEKRLAFGHVSLAEVAAVSEFHSLAECYESPSGGDWNSEAILQDSNWKRVVAAAAEAQKRLLLLLTDDVEQKALTTPPYGRERADADAFGSSIHGAKPVSSGRNVGGSNLGRLVLKRPATAETAHIPADVRSQLQALGFAAENSDGGVTYRIGAFALSKNSTMFAAYSQVRLVKESGAWVLELGLNKALWLVFLIVPLGFIGKPRISSLWNWDLAKGLAIAVAIFSTSVIWSRIRVSRWWNRL